VVLVIPLSILSSRIIGAYEYVTSTSPDGSEMLDASSKNTGRNGETNVTGGDVAAAALQRNATAATVNASRIVATVHIILSLLCGE
jgi:hypothetical protein